MSPLNAVQMQRALYGHLASQFAVLFEISTNLRPEIIQIAGEPFDWSRRRRIDVLLMRKARKQGIGPLDLLAIEIKISRSDFLADLREPAKQAPWREIAHRHAYAVPVGLISAEQVPAGSGLLTVGENTRWPDVHWAVRAPYSETPEIPSWLTLGLAYRLSAAEAKLRGLSGSANGDIESLRGELVHARNQIDRLNRAHNRALAEAREWRTAFAAGGGIPCRHCDQPVKPVSLRRGSFTGWRHADDADEGKCKEIRLAAGRLGPYLQVEPQDISDDTGGPS